MDSLLRQGRQSAERDGFGLGWQDSSTQGSRLAKFGVGCVIGVHGFGCFGGSCGRGSGSGGSSSSSSGSGSGNQVSLRLAHEGVGAKPAPVTRRVATRVVRGTRSIGQSLESEDPAVGATDSHAELYANQEQGVGRVGGCGCVGGVGRSGSFTGTGSGSGDGGDADKVAHGGADAKPPRVSRRAAKPPRVSRRAAKPPRVSRRAARGRVRRARTIGKSLESEDTAVGGAAGRIKLCARGNSGPPSGEQRRRTSFFSPPSPSRSSASRGGARRENSKVPLQRSVDVRVNVIMNAGGLRCGRKRKRQGPAHRRACRACRGGLSGGVNRVMNAKARGTVWC